MMDRTPAILCEAVLSGRYEATRALALRFSTRKLKGSSVLRAWFDGCCLPNPGGHAGAGAVVKRHAQRILTADALSGSGAGINVALASNGGEATASSAYPGATYVASVANNGDRKGAANSYWNDAAPANTFPDWLQVEFNGSKTIDEIDVFTEQDNWQSPSEPTEAMTFSLYGLIELQCEQ
jgi:hypothetical protein